MKPGDKVDLTEYDIQARINYASSPDRVVVAHNNSTHVLVFREPWDEANQMYNDCEAIFIKSFRYGHSPVNAYFTCYERALNLAVGIAIGAESDDGRD